MARRKRPTLDIKEVNAVEPLEQSWQVSSDAFTNHQFKVHGSGLEVIDERSATSSGDGGAAAAAAESDRAGKTMDGGRSAAAGRGSRSSSVGDLNADQLEIIRELGRGASSFVQLVRDRKTGKEMALKIINVFDKNMRTMLMREIKTLYKCDCHALVRVSTYTRERDPLACSSPRGALHECCQLCDVARRCDSMRLRTHCFLPPPPPPRPPRPFLTLSPPPFRPHLPPAQFSGCFYREGKISVAIEYMDMGSLDQVLNRFAPGGIPEDVLAAMTFQCLWGLSYLKHEHRLHRDIKPQNILLNSKGNVKLTDFGISRELENSIGKAMTIVGTFKYMSPERILAEKYSYSSDVWSMGLVLIECATNRYPYSGINSMIEMAQTVTESDPPTLEGDHFTSDFREFIALCLRKKAKERPAADNLLGDKWLGRHKANTMTLANHVCRQWVDKVLPPKEGKK